MKKKRGGKKHQWMKFFNLKDGSKMRKLIIAERVIAKQYIGKVRHDN